MFNYLKQIALENNIASAYNIVNMSGKLVYIEGAKNIVSFDEDCICVKVLKKSVEIVGTKLKIDKFCGSTLYVSGNIFNVFVKEQA